MEGERAGPVEYEKLPWIIWLLEKLGLCNLYAGSKARYKVLIFVWTFFIYTSYHLSRKPFSVVKVTLCPVCANCSNLYYNESDQSTVPGWPPFNDLHHGKTFLGSVDYSWLFSYAVCIFFSGYLADRLNLRYFLTVGMIGSGMTVCLLGMAYFADIHHLAFFVIIQIFGGALQSTGWPGVVAIMSNWFGKSNRGLIMGIWNSHTSVGNILGTIIPSFWAGCKGSTNDSWGWSFFIPGGIIMTFGVITFFVQVTSPTHLGFSLPTHHTKEDLAVGKEGKKKKKKPVTYSVASGSVSVDSGLDIANSQPVSSSPSNAPSKGIWKRLTGGHQKRELEDFSESDDAVLVRHREKDAGEESKTLGEKVKKEVEGKSSKAGLAKQHQQKEKAVTFFRALAIPGVVEFSLSLFFDKLVSYTFLYWLPLYVKFTRHELSGPQSDWLSTLFDVGGILGGIIAGVVSDKLNARATICVIFLLLAVPCLFVLRSFGDGPLWIYILLLIINGVFINGPYSIITTAVSSDLGTHPTLTSNQNAKAIVTAIIDGTGSLGAALGPLIVGIISDSSSWTSVFYFLMVCCLLSALLLSRLVYKEVLRIYFRFYNKCCGNQDSEDELRTLNPEADSSANEANYTDSEH